jgi:Ser/Thr protein kinase RdoA (MazF antagonist)
VDFLSDQLPVAWCRLYEKVFSAWPFPRLSKRLNAMQGITLIHRDAHPWNFLYPRNPEQDSVAIIDWHEWEVGLGADDLTETLVLWWEPERRSRLEESLVRRYHHQLIAQGVNNYTWEQCWNDYRFTAIRILFYPIWMHAEGRPPIFWQPILERSIQAFQDLKCVDLLE